MCEWNALSTALPAVDFKAPKKFGFSSQSVTEHLND